MNALQLSIAVCCVPTRHGPLSIPNRLVCVSDLIRVTHLVPASSGTLQSYYLLTVSLGVFIVHCALTTLCRLLPPRPPSLRLRLCCVAYPPSARRSVPPPTPCICMIASHPSNKTKPHSYLLAPSAPGPCLGLLTLCPGCTVHYFSPARRFQLTPTAAATADRLGYWPHLPAVPPSPFPCRHTPTHRAIAPAQFSTSQTGAGFSTGIPID